MTLIDIVAGILFVGVILYSVFGGADFGSGVWDLAAGSAERGAKMRRLIDHAIGPVWEANHVWLIFVLVYLFSAFPSAFGAFTETLWIPIVAAGFGIVLRGSAFALRKVAPTVAQARAFGIAFAISSVVTPFLLGTIAGAVASGRVPASGVGDVWTSWTGPTSIVGGVLAVATCAFLAAIFLVHEAGRVGDVELFETCRRNALAAGAVTGIVALAGIYPLENDAPTLFNRLNGRALPLILVSAAAGLTTMWLVWKRNVGVARLTGAVAVGSVVAGWGVAQYPYLYMDNITIDEAAGARPTLIGLVIVFLVAAITVVPSLLYLYWVTQRPSWSMD